MMGRLRRIGAVRAAGLGATLALFVVALVVFDPSPAPAAERSIDFSATPVAEVRVPPVDADECAVDSESAVETIVEIPPSIEEAATPIAIIPDETPTPACETEGTEPEPIEPVKPEIDPAPRQPEAIPTGSAAPEAATPASAASPEDATLTGLPIEPTSPEPVVDPSLAGIPLAGEPEMEAGAGDPMLFGVTTAAIEWEAGTPLDPFDVGLAEAEAAATLQRRARVDVDVISPGGSAVPGGRVSYIFKLSNPDSQAISFTLQPSINRSGWMVTVYAIGSATPLAGAISLGGGDEMLVVLIVAAPREASIGDKATASLEPVIER